MPKTPLVPAPLGARRNASLDARLDPESGYAHMCSQARPGREITLIQSEWTLRRQDHETVDRIQLDLLQFCLGFIAARVRAALSRSARTGDLLAGGIPGNLGSQAAFKYSNRPGSEAERAPRERQF